MAVDISIPSPLKQLPFSAVHVPDNVSTNGRGRLCGEFGEHYYPRLFSILYIQTGSSFSLKHSSRDFKSQDEMLATWFIAVEWLVLASAIVTDNAQIALGDVSRDHNITDAGGC